MRPSSFFAVGMLVALFACGDDDETGTGGAGGNAATSTASASSTQSTTSSTASSSVTTISSSSSTSTGDGGGTLSDIDPTITEALIFADCQPIVGPDPIGGTIEVDYVNTGDAAGTLTVTGVGLQLMQNNMTLDWTFEVMPATVGPVAPMSTLPMTHTKVVGSGSGTKAGAPCDFCGAPGILFVDYQDDEGNPATATFMLDGLGCAL